MSVITKGKTFTNGEQLTAGKLNQMLDAAVFSSAAVDNTKTTLSGGAITIAPNAITSTEIAQSFLDKIYPIGSIYTNATNGTNPGTLLGFGTWVSFGAGKVPVGIDSSDGDFDTAEETGGAKTHTLTIGEIPNATGRFETVRANVEFANGVFTRSVNSRGAGNSTEGGDPGTTVNFDLGGGGGAHNNLQPYIVVYMWKRTA
jgi:hypothetical protein